MHLLDTIFKIPKSYDCTQCFCINCLIVALFLSLLCLLLFEFPVLNQQGGPSLSKIVSGVPEWTPLICPIKPTINEMRKNHLLYMRRRGHHWCLLVLTYSGVLATGGGNRQNNLVGIGETTGIAVWKSGGEESPVIRSCPTPVSSAVVTAELHNPMSCF